MQKGQETAFIGLGSNLATPQKQLKCALDSLQKHPKIKVSGVSSFYLSDPLGPPDQPRYTNAVAQLQTQLSPWELLQTLQLIEHQQGRTREQGKRWGPRTLDLDILLYGALILDTPQLHIPHYHMHARSFVLYPLAELLPLEYSLPCGTRLQTLLASCPAEGLECLDLPPWQAEQSLTYP